MKVERVPRAALVVFGLVAVVLLSMVAGCGGGDDDSSASGSGEPKLEGDGYPGVDPANTRNAKGTIDRSNVNELQEVWSRPLTAQSAFGAHASSPVIVNGVIYSQDLESNVEAIALDTGEVLWTKTYGDLSQGPNGVVVAEDHVFGATSKEAFALDQKTGEEVWSTPLVTKPKGEGIDMAPGYSDGLVYVSTVPLTAEELYPGGGVGTLYALDAKTGQKKWDFATVPKGLWGNPKVNSGGGLWQPPTFDGKGNIYFGTGNPAPYPGTAEEPWGASRPGPNLYTNSMVKMDAKTGKMDWYYQQTPHDLYDWDFQDPPLLLEAGGRELAIGAGKSGIVTAVDAKTGKRVWERPVGSHNGHDDDGLLAMRGEASKIKNGTLYPGVLGGVIAPMATNGELIFVSVVNQPGSISATEGLGEGGTESIGEVIAIDPKSGAIRWEHQLATPPYGAPTVVNDLVFAITFNGVVQALDASIGKERWAAQLPAGINTSVSISGDTVIAPAGIATEEGQKPKIVAFRLGG